MFAAIADTVINLVPGGNGVVIFCATHACLIYWYLRRKPYTKSGLRLLLPVAAVGAVFVVLVAPHFNGFMRFGVPVYVGLLCVMLWRALCLRQDGDGRKICLGSLLFFITDLCIILELVYGDLLPLVVIACCATRPRFSCSA